MMKKCILVVLVIWICVHSYSECSCPVCTDIDNFGDLILYNFALNSTFKVFTDFGLLRCVQQCMFRTRCQSINFDLSTQTCELNQDTSSGPFFRNGSVCTTIIIWPKRLALSCENHYCNGDSACVIKQQGDQDTISCVKDIFSPVDKGYIKAPDFQCYYKLYTTKKTYVNARKTCQDDGARVIEPDTEEKNAFISGVMEGRASFVVFIGARDFNDTGDWRWESSNASLIFNDWDPTEPQAGKGERCAGYYKDFEWRWVNLECTWAQQFMCEITIE